jgi:hypothetical protein
MRYRVDIREYKNTDNARQPFKTIEATMFTCKGAGTLIGLDRGVPPWADKGIIIDGHLETPERTKSFEEGELIWLCRSREPSEWSRSLRREPFVRVQYVNRKVPSALRL